jgi:adenylate kinase
MSPTRVLCAGPPGSDRDNYIQILCKLAGPKKTPVSHHHLFDFIVEEAKLNGYSLNKVNILDFFLNNPDKLLAFRMEAVKKMGEEMKSKHVTAHIVSTPYFFEWKGESLTGLCHDEIKILDPDIFIIVIDDVVRVRERLSQDPQWKGHTFNLSEIAKWRREEIKGIYNFAHDFVPPRKCYILAREHPVDVFYDLILNQEKKRVYISYPITGVDPEKVAEARDIAKELSGFFTIFDPLTIHDWAIVDCWKHTVDEGTSKSGNFDCEVEYATGKKTFSCDASEVEYAIKDIRRQIVDRDYKLIDSSDYVFVYHPRKSISAGVMCEMMHAKIEGKMVYAMYPFEPSPFFDYYANRIFGSKKGFLDFVQSLA